MRTWSYLMAAAVLLGVGLACQTVTNALSPPPEGAANVGGGGTPTVGEAERAASPSPPPAATVEPTACPATVEVERSPAFGGELYVEAGQEITLRWHLTNDGPCPWTPAFRIVPEAGTPEVDVDPVDIGQPVPQGESVEVELTLSAPTDPETYSLVFQLESPAGDPVLLPASEDPGLPVRINVVEPGEVVRVQGLQVPPAGCVDLDQLRRSACERGLVDILYVSNLMANLHQISPLDGAALRPYGATPPSSVETCGEFAMTEEEVGLREGWVYCFRTAAGRLGWFQLQSASGVVSMDVTVAH